MGYLHEGHLSLVREARSRADRVVVSIFVNPTQFGENEDLSTYPRDTQGDLDKLAAEGVDAVFLPSPATVYPAGYNTYVVPSTLSERLCGEFRPGHFRGVCTVVSLLFRMTQCHVALFGKKDYQQLRILEQMSQDLWLGVEVVGMPIVRENDGLAMSSRNAYLSQSERQQALSLSQALAEAEKMVRAGQMTLPEVLKGIRAHIESQPDTKIDYIELVDAQTLEPVSDFSEPTLCAMAVFVGKTRLIDNRVLVRG
jgi:pantoate--beta-alanine ligase